MGEIRIRSITSIAKDLIPDGELEEKRTWAGQEAIVETVTLPAGAPLFLGIDYDIAYAASFIVDEVKRAEASGVDAVIIDCFADPALEACREVTLLPVIGCGQAGTLTALSLGERIGIIVPNEMSTVIAKRSISKLGVTDKVTYWDSVLSGSGNIHKDQEKTCEKASGSNHCDVIIIGCTSLGRYWQDIKGRARLPIPVVRPFPCAVRWAELLVALGVSQSQRSYPLKSRAT